ncbi:MULTISPECIES: MDR family MFS transporter [unclassified Devosia]|uniref:MDR family MFS transporter n=1 Tax=unclassified Devosia TaxID=196773 RepID=UPI00145EF167|nr:MULTISPECIES: MDR family MFS transporter [unclassified Devosia]MBJ6988248.1 multidrug efflux MFS transporter [Devosia sp. MC521]MBJ7577586.1 multidrug efflux MFS transporter [Devosia sp. MC532]QMW63238.1 multidrug efflux MFS transporter [Devosia sp. MC521]
MSQATMDGAVKAAPHQPEDAARNNLVIALLLVSAFVMFLNETIMSVAIPQLMIDLNITAGSAQWLTTAFLLTMAIVIPITGYLLQRFHTRPIFTASISIFSVGTLICAIAPGIELLIVGRVVQAVGTAIMMPLLMTTVMSLVPANGRGKVMGNISIVMSVAPAIGPTIGGFILAHFAWRYMFYFTLPIAIVTLVVGYLKVQNVSEPRKTPLDVISVILSALGFGGLVFGLSSLGGGGHGGSVEHAAEQGASMPAWVPVVVGVVAMAIFVWRQIQLQKSDKALLDLRVLTHGNYSVSLVTASLAMVALLGSSIMLPLYTQQVLGLDTLQTGMLMLPGGLIMGVLAPLVGRLYDQYGPRPLMVPGVFAVSAVMWFFSFVGTDTPVWLVVAAHIIMSIGLAFVFTPMFTAAMGSVPKPLYSHASATLSSVQQVAGAAGIALFVALMSLTSAAQMAEGIAPVEAMAAGVRASFICGGIATVLMLIAAWFVKKPEGEGPGEGFAGH